MNLQQFFEILSHRKPNNLNFEKNLLDQKTELSLNLIDSIFQAATCLEEEEICCQIGCSDPTTLIASLCPHEENTVYLTDPVINVDRLSKDLEKFNLENRVIYSAQSSAEFFLELQQIAPETKIGLCLYDAINNNYRDLLLALFQAKEFLSSQAVIFVYNSQSGSIQQAIADFLLIQNNCYLSEQFTDFFLLVWNKNKLNQYNWQDFSKKYNHQHWLEYLTKSNQEYAEKNNNSYLESLYKEALALAKNGQLQLAEIKYKKILQINKYHAPSWLDLGIAYYQMSAYQDALNSVLSAIALNPNVAVYHYTLGLIWESIGKNNNAIEAYQKALEINPDYIEAYNNLGNIYFDERDIDKAESLFDECIKRNPDHFGAYFNKFLVIYARGKIKEAIKFAAHTSQLFPEEVYCKLKANILLPMLYENEIEIEEYRFRFYQGLEKIQIELSKIDLSTEIKKNKVLHALNRHSNFFLAYQNKNDRELQEKYGQLVTQIMTKIYPQWTQTINLPPLTNEGKIKVGYISNFMERNHTIGKLFVGWIKHHNTELFETYCYYLDSPFNFSFSPTKSPLYFQKYSDYYRNIYGDLEKICHQIQEDKLHILVFLDLGLASFVTQIAALRLAPIQCLTWGHPVTSGLATIDYFISSELMEGQQVKDHYSEILIKLPNISISYPKPFLPECPKTRTQFDISENSIVYLSCQSIMKYLPQHDYIFAEIAKAVPQAQFVFIKPKIVKFWVEKFQNRLTKAFAKYGLNIRDHCLFIAGMKHEDYLSLNLCSDIYLDTLSWSGGNSTLEAIACNLPVVTCPGELMRTRHSYGILKMLGVEETIANNEQEYIEIAVNLGLDKNWRQSIVNKIKANHHRLYNDLTCVKELEDFYQKVIANYPEKLIGSNL